jgi:N-acetylmuramate 1-kinase
VTGGHVMPADARERIDAYLAESGLADRRAAVTALTADASDRRYFRVAAADSAPIVLALHAGPIEFATMPFVNVAGLLHRMEIPAPSLLGHSDPLGIIALEDLGDVTLQAHLGAGSVSDHWSLYVEAVRLVRQLQQRGREFASTAYVPYTLAFDVEKLTFEFDFFTTHFLEGYRGVVFEAAERTALATELAAIVEELAAEPRVVCHRDYHSRNLMVHRGRLYLIDFQDARMGPDTYDLVSLLRDSYVDVTDRERDGLIAEFCRLSSIADGGEFRRRFDLMSVQRNIKALGTFGFQASARGNAAYVEYMPRTLRSVRENLARYTRFSRLRELLAAHVAELR